ncbi:MAG TPA: alpha/beta hydrolase [Acidimicrobiia bacterium]|nr:alpha/beta hydrolase [Acidimicrobiia bacterium]
MLVLLHGLGVSAVLNWAAAFPVLARSFRVIAPDHRGHGRTPPGPEPFTLAGSAGDALAVADALGVDHFIAVGYSMGGPIAQLMWRSQPSRVAGLVLAATSRDFRGRPRDRIGFQALGLALAGVGVPGSGIPREVVLRVLAPRLSGSARRWVLDELRRGDSRRMLEAATDLGRFSSRTWIGDVDIPTSVIVAMNDQVVPTRRQLKLAQAIRGSVAAFVDGDHYAAGGEVAEYLRILEHECLTVQQRVEGDLDVPPAYWDVQSA